MSSYNITPDLLLIALVYFSLKEGKIFGSISGFAVGFIIDLLSGSFLGLLALSYTITGFISGFFKKEDDRFLLGYRFLIIVFVFSLLCNLIYFTIYLQGSGLLFLEIIYKYILTASAYTTLLSVVVLLIQGKKQLSGVSY